MNLKHKLLLISIALCILCTVCSCDENGYINSDFFAMNTYISLTAETNNQSIGTDIKELIISTEKQLSAHYDNSDICNPSNSNSNTYQDTMNLIVNALRLSEMTQGAFDFTLGTVTKLWNITGVSPSVPKNEELAHALEHTGYKKVSVVDDKYVCDDPLLKLDLGAIAKGYAGDKAISYLLQNGVKNACISLGGNISVIGSSQNNEKKGIEGWNVGIKNPFSSSEIIGTLNVTNATVSVSGSYERFFEQDGKIYHHIFDPSNGYPANSGLASVAVICKDGYVADALSTALFVMGYENAMDFYNSHQIEFEAVFCTDDGTVTVTDGIKSEFIPNHNAVFSYNNTIQFIR